MSDVSSTQKIHSPLTTTTSNGLAQDFDLTNTIRHPSNSTPRSERNKRLPQRKITLKKSKKRYSTDDIILKPTSLRNSSIHDVPSRKVSHVSSVISSADKYYLPHDRSKPSVLLTPASPVDQDINSDDNISYQDQSITSETELGRNSKLADLILKPRNALRGSDAYRHFSRIIRPKGNPRGVLTPSEASERSNGIGTFMLSDTNSEEEFSQLRYMRNRNMHNLVFYSQDMEKNLDAIKSDIERVKGDLREMKSGYAQVEKKSEDLEMKLSDYHSRITNIERILTDFTEMHHNEVQELKQQLQQLQYDSVARVQDLEEGQDELQRKLIELEVRSNMQESAAQLFAPNGGGFFRSLLFKVLNVIVLLLSIFAMTTVKVISQFREHKVRFLLILSIIICVIFLTYDVINNGFRIFELLFVVITRLVNYM